MSDDDIIKAGNNDGNDLDNADFDDVGGFDDDFEEGGSGQTLGDLMKNSPLFKLGVVVGVIALVIGVVVLFGGGKEDPVRSSRAPAARDVTQAPGEEVSDSVAKALQEYNETQVEQAVARGESALPVPIGSTRGRVGLEEEPVVAEDPLDRWRRLQEERQKRTQTQGPQLPSVNPNAEQIDRLTKSLQSQMDSILSSKTIKGTQTVSGTAHEWVDKRLAAEDKRRQDLAAQSISNAAAAEKDKAAQIILPAGSIEYAQLLIEANSDAVGPVLAQIVSGPLAGSRILGSFKTEEEYLVLTFNQVVIDGVVHSTNAVALDPETTGIGIVTDIDNRYFKRVILPAAAKFVEGMAGAIAEKGTEVYVVGNSSTVVEQKPELNTNEQIYKGLEEAAGSVADMMDEEAGRTKRQIKVRAGTPVGLLFTQPVTEKKAGAGRAANVPATETVLPGAITAVSGATEAP